MALTAYLKLKGVQTGEIKGDCQQKGREGTIMIYAVDHTIEIPKDPQSGLPTGSRLHRPMSVTTSLGRSAPQIFQLCCTGERCSAELDYYRIDEKGQEVKYFTIKLDDAIVVETQNIKENVLLQENAPLHDMVKVSFAYGSITWREEINSIEAEDSWKGK